MLVPGGMDWGPCEPPFAAQRTTCDLLTTTDRAYVLNQKGTGKSRCALWAWRYLRNTEPARAGRLLVVAKKSTLRFTWESEIFKALGPEALARTATVHASKAKRIELLADLQYDILVINHDGIKVIYEELWEDETIGTVVIDEFAAFRNPSDRSKCMRAIAHKKRIVWGMGANPIPQSVLDAWMPGSIITPSSFPKYRGRWRDLTMYKVNDAWMPKPDALETVYRAMQPSVRITLDEVVELPPVSVPPVVEVPLSPEQDKTYKALKRLFLAHIQGQKITALNAAVLVGKLLQVAGGWVYDDERGVVSFPCPERIQTVMDLIESTERKVILLVPYLHMLAGLEKALTVEKVDVATVRKDNIDLLLHDFQNTPKYKVLLSHPKRISHGLTLTAANMNIWWLPTGSHDDFEQTNGRIRRVGQEHKQYIYRIGGTAVENRMYRNLETREQLQNTLLDMFEGEG